jgi:hypothetical protein
MVGSTVEAGIGTEGLPAAAGGAGGAGAGGRKPEGAVPDASALGASGLGSSPPPGFRMATTRGFPLARLARMTKASSPRL